VIWFCSVPTGSSARGRFRLTTSSRRAALGYWHAAKRQTSGSSKRGKRPHGGIVGHKAIDWGAQCGTGRGAYDWVVVRLR
jgi:hypothetical protein